MKYSLDDIYNQSVNDTYALQLDGDGYESRMVYGTKIIKDKLDGSIQILNTARGGDYYSHLTTEQLNNFLEKGWRYGVFVLSLSNYRSKLDIIEQRIKLFINEKKSEKQILQLKASRERILAKYSEINFKLNQLNQLNYGNKVNNEEANNI
jgi:hypothetical protein